MNAMLEQDGDEPVKIWLGPFLMIALKNPEHLEVSVKHFIGFYSTNYRY